MSSRLAFKAKTISLVPFCLLIFACGIDNKTESTSVLGHSFDIHFVVLTDKYSGASLESFQGEVDIMNQYFVTQDRESIFDFRLKSVSLYQDIQMSDCEFARVGDAESNLEAPYRVDLQQMFNQCDDTLIRDTQAINVYVFDSYRDDSFDNSCGIAFENTYEPFILLDYNRLPHVAAVEEHELGHVFGLGHIPADVLSNDESSNIMSSIDGKCPGADVLVGRRDIGFNGSQLQIIQDSAVEIISNFQ